MRAGLVASAVYNVHRKRGADLIQPRDFLAEERHQQVQYVDGAMMRDLVGRWLKLRRH